MGWPASPLRPPHTRYARTGWVTAPPKEPVELDRKGRPRVFGHFGGVTPAVTTDEIFRLACESDEILDSPARTTTGDGPPVGEGSYSGYCGKQPEHPTTTEPHEHSHQPERTPPTPTRNDQSFCTKRPAGRNHHPRTEPKRSRCRYARLRAATSGARQARRTRPKPKLLDRAERSRPHNRNGSDDATPNVAPFFSRDQR